LGIAGPFTLPVGMDEVILRYNEDIEKSKIEKISVADL
jgi:hypothetical protein